MANLQTQTQAERLSNLESLIAETGFEDELKARRRVDIDKQRVALAVAYDAIPDTARGAAARSKEMARTHAATAAARTVLHDCEHKEKEALIGCVMDVAADAGKKQSILTDLEHKAPFEVSLLLEDLSFADQLLRRALRIDSVADRTWTGHRVKRVTSNLDGISRARDQIDEAQRAILDLRHDGRMSSDEMVKRCTKIEDAALEPAFEFIPREMWDLRHSRSPSDLIATVAGYQN